MQKNHFIKEVCDNYRRSRDIEKVAKELSQDMIEITIDE